MKLFISPHNDDEVLFGAFTLMVEKPVVVIVYDSYVQAERGIKGCSWAQRRMETIAACGSLGIPPSNICFLALPDNQVAQIESIAVKLRFIAVEASEVSKSEITTVYAPANYSPKGNQHHNKVSLACNKAFSPEQLRFYHTYTAEGKVTKGRRVPIPENMPAVSMKLAALLEYESQLELWSTRDHFLRDQYEYMEDKSAEAS